MNKIILISIIFILSFVETLPMLAQPSQQNQQKYWVYRKRFFDKFIFANTNPDPLQVHYGYNIPCDIRHVFAESANDMTENHRYIHWGDATIYLAQYICVLATEYKLLLDDGQSTTETLSLLVAALNTFNRLDQNAETYYQDSNGHFGSKQMNGFFIRDDIPKNDTLTTDTWSDDWNNHFLTENMIGVRYADIDNPLECAECSPDQIWHLVMAMALVKKLVAGPSANFDNYGTYRITEMAEIITRKMIKIMHSDQNMLPDEWYIPFSAGTTPVWMLRNPLTGAMVHRGAVANEGAMGMDYAFGEAGTKIAGLNPYLHYAGSIDNEENFRLAVNEVAGWETFAYKGYKILSLATIIGDVMGWPWQDHIDETYKTLLGVTKSYRFFEHLPLIFKILHNEQTDLHSEIFDLKTFIESLLNCAPECGPYCYSTPYPHPIFSNEWLFNYSYANRYWSSPNRLFNPESLVDINGQGGYGGEFNGLDYLLLHNLYRLVYKNQSYVNFSQNLTWHSDFPYTIGNQNVEFIGARNHLTADNTINSGADIAYAAGQSITLQPGFHAMAGSTFHAYINESYYFHPYNQLYTCSNTSRYAYIPEDTSENQLFSETTERTDNKVKLIQSGKQTPLQVQLQLTENIENKEKTHVMLQETETISSNKTRAALPQSVLSVNSDKTEIQAIDNKPYSVSVFPNPNSGKFLVEISGSVPVNATVSLKDLLGKTVYNGSIMFNSNTIDVSADPSGIYLITVCVGSDCWLGKVVKE